MLHKVPFWLQHHYYFCSTTFPLSLRSFIWFMALTFLSILSSSSSVASLATTCQFSWARWYCISKLPPNVSKCPSICHSLKSSSASYHIQDLAVTFDDKLRLDSYCGDICNHRFRMSDFMLRTPLTFSRSNPPQDFWTSHVAFLSNRSMFLLPQMYGKSQPSRFPPRLDILRPLYWRKPLSSPCFSWENLFHFQLGMIT